MNLNANVTVEGDTYPEGTDVSKVKDKGHREVLEAYMADHADESVDSGSDEGSAGAGKYDGKEWTKAKLQEELDARNSELPDSDQIQPESTKNGDLIAALERLDELHPVTQ